MNIVGQLSPLSANWLLSVSANTRKRSTCSLEGWRCRFVLVAVYRQAHNVPHWLIPKIAQTNTHPPPKWMGTDTAQLRMTLFGLITHTCIPHTSSHLCYNIYCKSYMVDL